MNPEDSRPQEPPMKNDMDPLFEERERIEGEIRNLGASTIGAFLKSKRQAKNLTLDEVDLITHIGPRWTEAIEEGTWSLYPSMLYAKGHIRGYCEALGLPSEILLDYYSKELIAAFPEEIFHPHPVLQVNQILQESSSSSRANTSSGVSRLLFWLLAGLVLFVGLLGALKVWMDKAEKRHSEEKAKHSTKTVSPPRPALPPSGGGSAPSASQPASPTPVTPAPAPPVPSPASEIPTPGSSPDNQNKVSPVAPAASPTSLQETSPASPPVDSAKLSQPAAGTSSSLSGQTLSDRKEQPLIFHKLKVTALKDTYVAVKEGDGRARRYALMKGKSKTFRSKTEFWVSTKDAGAILLSLDGHALGPPGPENKSIQHKKVVLKNSQR